MADFLEAHPASTAAEIDAICELGSVRKVLSDMAGPMGYGIRYGWRMTPDVVGKGPRKRRTYTLMSRPALSRQLGLSFGR